MSADIILDWALQTGIAITCLTGFILVIRRPFARRFGAGAAYTLWALPLLRLFMPPINIPIIKPALSIPPTPLNGMQYALPIDPAAIPMTSPAPIHWAFWLTALWLGVALLWLGRELYRQKTYVAALRVNSRPLAGKAISLAQATAKKAGFKAVPEIRISSSQVGPLVTGVFRPLIIVPHNFGTHFSPQQQDMTLMHELAHIKRRDLWAALTALIFRAINWPNPLVHFAARRFRADQEAACDASVLRLMGNDKHTARTYAETLLHAAKHAVQPTQKMPPYNMPMGLTIYHPLKERLMIMTTKTRKATFLSRLAAGSLLIGAVALTSPISLAGSPGGEELAGKPTTTQTSTRVIKSVQDVDGVKTETHYEIITENGKTKAYSIDKNGLKTKVDANVIEMEHGPHMSHGQNSSENSNVMVFRNGDGKDIERRIEIITEDEFGPMDGQHKNVIIKKLGDGKDGSSKQVKVYSFSTSDNITLDLDDSGTTMIHGTPAKAMVSAAHGLLENLNDEKLSAKSKRKLEKARKALIEAQEAIEAEK